MSSHPTMPLLDPARGLQRPTNELRAAFEQYLMIFLYFMIYDNDNCSLASPPVVESEHVVIVLDVILIEQNVNLTNKCLIAIIYNLAIPPL